MKIIYLYRKNHYAAFIAAYMHLNLNIEHALYQSPIKKNQFMYMGLDDKMNEIYILHCDKNKKILSNLLIGIGKIYDEEIKIINLQKVDKRIYLILKDRLIKKMI